MFIYLYVLGLYFLCIIPSSVCDICLTCLCSATDEGPIINCHGKDLGSNDMLNVDLLMLDEHQTLNEFILSNNSIIHLPGHLLKKLKHLKSLDLSGNLVHEIPAIVFSDLSNLKTLNFSKNMLKTFDDSLLKILPALLVLNLSYNNIDTIEHTMGQLTGKINLLDLSHNNISNLSSHIFESLPHLEYLDLSFNKINSLKEETLVHLNSLRTLRVNNNFLASIHLQVLPKSLIELHSGYNSITEIFYEPSQIQVLNIEYNRLPRIEKNLTMLNQLQHLNVCGNALYDFPSITLKKLKTLDVSSNKLPDIPEALSTENFPALLKLNMSKNPIRKLRFHSNLRLHSFVISNIILLESIDQGAFLKLEAPSNECLNLTISNNEKLSFVHEKALEHLNLCSLDLSNNGIPHVSSKLFAFNASLKMYSINLQGNPFECNCSLQWMLDDLVPKLYSEHPNLLDNLRCASPSQISNMRMVHWYGWKGQVFCTDMSDFVADLTINVASVSSSKVIIFESTPGLLAVLGAAIAVLTILVIIGLLLTRRISSKRRRINRRF